MIPELLAFNDCCGQLPCRGGVDTVRFSLTINSVCDGLYGFGPNLLCLPNRPLLDTPEATALALFNDLFTDAQNVNVMLSGATVTWEVNTSSLMAAFGLTELQALTLLTSNCIRGYTTCTFFNEITCDPDCVSLSTDCSCQQVNDENTADCCGDPCYQTYETGLPTALAFIARQLVINLMAYADANSNTYPSTAGFPASAFPEITDWGQSCYDFSCAVAEAPDAGIGRRFSMLWTPKNGNPCLHSFAAEANTVLCVDEGDGYVQLGIVMHYILAGYVVGSMPVLSAYGGDCALTFNSIGAWVAMVTNVGGIDAPHPPEYVFPCELGVAASAQLPAQLPACAPVRGWCLKAMPGDRIAFVLEDSIQDLLPGTYGIGYATIQAGCPGDTFTRIGSLFVTPNPVTGRLVGFLDSALPANLAPGCYKLVISSNGAEYFPAIEVEAGPNLLTVGSNGTFDTSAWHSGINEPTGVILAQYGSVYRSAFFSLNAFNDINTDSNVFSTDPIPALEANQSYILEAYINGTVWPTDPLKSLAMELVGVTGTETLTLLSAQPNNGSPTGEWLSLSYQIDTGTSPAGFSVNMLWDGPAFEEGSYYDIFVDDMSIRLAPYTIAATAPSPGVNKCSECITVLRDDCFTGQVRFSNSGNGLEYPYLLGPSGFRQQFRLDWMRMEYNFPAERSLYTNSRGRTVVNHSRLRKEREYLIGHAPEYVHEILVLALEHDSFEVNMAEAPGWEAYVNEKDYKVLALETYPKLNLRRGQVTLRLKDYDKVNAYC